jgi:acyl-CoA reductase-like NAD-dependent aldehyde dehydrogenase
LDKASTQLALPETPRAFGFFVDGQNVQAGDRAIFERHSPAHDVAVTRLPICTSQDVDAAVAAARAAFNDRRWAGLSGADRAAVLLKTARGIEARLDEIAYWETLESGKPIAQARAEVGGTVGMFEYAAGLARSLHGDSFNNLGDGMFGVMTREPVGVVGIITPWNFPFLILCERVPSEFTSATTVILAEILTEAGLPAGVMNVVTGTGPTVGQTLAEHMDVDMLSFTGSTRTGRAVVAAAGNSNFKRLGLELGGKNPQIVFADADLEDV